MGCCGMRGGRKADSGHADDDAKARKEQGRGPASHRIPCNGKLA